MTGIAFPYWMSRGLKHETINEAFLMQCMYCFWLLNYCLLESRLQEPGCLGSNPVSATSHWAGASSLQL